MLNHQNDKPVPALPCLLKNEMNDRFNQQHDEQHERPQQHAERPERVRLSLSHRVCRAVDGASRPAVRPLHVIGQPVQLDVLLVRVRVQLTRDRLDRGNAHG